MRRYAIWDMWRGATSSSKMMSATRPKSLSAVATRAVEAEFQIIVADGGKAAEAARNATRTIPIIAIMGVDPVDRGWSASLARPGGNLTGMTTYGLEVDAKQLELLLEIIPSARRIALLFSKQGPITLRTMREACQRAGVDAQEVGFTSRAEAQRVLTATAFERVDGIIVLADPLTGELLDQIVTLANGSRRPAIYTEREYVERGGLISYGINIADVFRRAAVFVDRVLKGISPPTCRSNGRTSWSWLSMRRRRARSASSYRDRSSRAPTR